jgi:pyrroline-5-carboxylate reductase
MTKADKPRLGFIGTGTIAVAIVEGLSASGAEAILLSPRNAEIAAGLAARFAHVDVATDNQAVLDNTDAVLLAVRPQVADAVLGPLRFRPDHRVISLIATVSLDRLRGWTAPAAKVVRAVPLPPVARGEGPTALFPPDAEARALFDRLGIAIELSDESEFDIFTTATATMASYFAFAHSIANWMQHGGVEAGKARIFVAQMLKGLAQTAIAEPQSSFAALATEHQTDGGINEQVFRAVTRAGVIPDLSVALDAVAARLHQTS